MASESKKGGGAGKIFLGIFLGFLLTLGLICGAGFYLYFNLSLNWLGKFGLHLDTGSEKLNSMTVKNLIDTSVSLVNNINSVTIADIEEDFDIVIFKDGKLFDIDVSDLRQEKFSNLANAVKNKFKTISAYELGSAINLDKLSGVLESPKTFYVKQTGGVYKLYTDAECETEATDIDVTITTDDDGLKVTVKTFIDSKATVQDDGSVQLVTKYLPLSYALSDVDNNTVAELLSYKEVTPGVYKEDNGNGEEVKGIMKVLAPLKISQISGAMDRLEVGQIFEGKIAGTVLSLIPSTTPISNIASSLAPAVQGTDVDTLVTLGVLNIANYEDIKDIQVGSAGKLAEISLKQLIDACIDSLVNP